MQERRLIPLTLRSPRFSRGSACTIRLDRLALLLLGLLLVLIWLASNSMANAPPQQYGYQVIREYPHDPEAFTQGLAYDRGSVYESTGLYGKSSLRQVDLGSGEIIKIYEHKKEIFAEGIAVWADKIYQLTWQNELILEFDREGFSLLQLWPHDRQGWGATHDGEQLIISDGSAVLYYLDPVTMQQQRVIEVHDQFGPVQALNELEYVNGQIFANIYQQDRIAIISPDDGRVSGYLDLSRLAARVKEEGKAGVLNGIMYDPDNDRLFVTGKLWPWLFEIRLLPEAAD